MDTRVIDRTPPPHMQNGVVVGRFDPLHAGHGLVLDFARAYVPHLTVFVRASPRDTTPATLRCAWVAELWPDAAVYVLEEPAEAAAATIRARLPGPPAALFSSDPAQHALATALGAQHIIVDPAHAMVPVKSAAVRARPLDFWPLLPPPVQAHYALRVALVGAESTGKTTLAAQLADHFDTVWQGEYLRTWIDHKGLPVVPADVHHAARGQQAAEWALARRCNRILFCDTDLWQSVAYSAHYYGAAPGWIVEAAKAQKRDLYLLLEPDVPWVPDPQRDGPHLRALIQARLERLLAHVPAPVVRVHGSWETRFASAVSAITPLLTPTQLLPDDAC